MNETGAKVCPRCGSGRNRVGDTRVRKDGDVKRTRECLDCGMVWPTVETALPVAADTPSQKEFAENWFG